jgi:hypothetical protein
VHDAAGHLVSEAHERGDAGENQRRDERHRDREVDDVAARRGVGDEELGVVPEYVEQRLRDGERPRHDDRDRVEQQRS